MIKQKIAKFLLLLSPVIGLVSLPTPANAIDWWTKEDVGSWVTDAIGSVIMDMVGVLTEPFDEEE